MRKLIANSKGFSSVIGTTFMVLVMMLLGTGVFMWTLRQNTLYYQAVKEKNQIEVDRLNERVKAFNANYAVEDSDVSVAVELQNQGPLSVQIVNLWVVDVNTGNYNFSKSLSVNYLQPGGNATLAATVTIIDSAHEHRFSSWLITGRGNVVPLEEKEEKEEITVADVATGIGSIAMNFTNFKYYNVTYNVTKAAHVLKNYPNGGDGYNVIQGEKGIAFQVCLTNFDRNGRDINLSSASVLWTLFPTSAAAHSGWWYIVNVDDDGTISNDFTQITLPYGVQTFVFFASSREITDKKLFDPSSTTYSGPAAVNLMLVGTIGTSTYGQNVPFVSIYVG